jgi:hypothetical protein
MAHLVIQYGCLIGTVTGASAASAMSHSYRNQLRNKQD